MDQEPEITPPPKPVIPPPDLSRPAPPPRSPFDSGPPSPPPSGPAAVKVTIRSAADEGPALEVVTFNTRAIAAVIDVVVAMGIQIGLTILLPDFVSSLAWVAGFGYLIARDTLPFLGGQSVGKKAMKFKVVTLDGNSLIGNWEAALIRNGVLLIPFFALVELFILLTREERPERGRRLGDEWAKTKMIVEEKPPVPDDNG